MDNGEFFEKLLARLRREDRFLLTTHRNPDPDGLGAQIALRHLLANHFQKDVRIVNQDPISTRFAFLDPEGHARTLDESNPQELTGRTVVMLDNSDLDRCGGVRQFVHEDLSNLIIIDHHDGIEADYEVQFQNAAIGSTSEIIYELLELAGIQPPFEVARGLYAGLIADTGHFRYRKTRPRSHMIAARLLECGVNPPEVADELFDSFEVERLLIKRELYKRLELNEERTIAWFRISKREIENLGGSSEDIEGVINELLEPGDIKIALLFSLRDAELTRVSVRSKGSVDMLPAVTYFGGGGHRNAAGATLHMELDEAIQTFLPRAEKCLADYFALNAL